jgi:DNA repair exonuclease SbcCD nuclease subunit
MKALHAADIHLDSPLRGLALYEEAPVSELRSATRRAFDGLVDLAIEEQVALLLLAGDIFDGDWAHYATGAHFVRQMLRLQEAGIAVVAIAGNHDAESKLTKSLRLPANVTMLSTRRPQTWTNEDVGVAVHGQGYATPAVLEDLCRAYPAPVPGLINLGLLHTSADGRPGHERYAPCSVQTMVNCGYDYFALGHVHSREVLSQTPPIVFSGALQGRGMRETGAKGATLLDVEDGTVCHAHRVLDVVRWEVLSVDAADAGDLDEVCSRVTATIRDAAQGLGDRLLAAQVRITGASAAHGSMVLDSERTREEMILAAADGAGDQVWLQGAVIETIPEHAVTGGRDDAVGELMAELDEILASDSAVMEISRTLAPLADVLTLAALEQFNPKDPLVVRELLGEVRRTLPAALTQEMS